MIVYFAGAKSETKSEPFSDPRIAVGHDLNIMITFFEFRGKLSKEKRIFLKGLDKDFLEYEKRKEKNVASRTKKSRRSNRTK